MPKLKTRRSAWKRYRFTSSGKVKVWKPGRRHHMHLKSEKRKRGLKSPSYLSAVLADKVRKQLPYGSR